MKRITNAPLKVGRLTFRCLMKLFVDSEAAFMNAAESWPWFYGIVPPTGVSLGRRENIVGKEDLDLGPASANAKVTAQKMAKQLQTYF